MTETTNKPQMLQILQMQWKTVIFVALVGTIIFMVKEEFVRPAWRAKATILMAFDDQAATLGGGLLASKADPIKMLGAVLASQSLNDQVAKGVGFKGKKVPFDVRVDSASGQIFLTFSDNSKSKAKYTLDKVMDGLKDIEGSTGFTTASQEAKKLEKLVSDRQEDVLKSERDLKVFQDNLKTVVTPNVPYYGGQYRALMEPIKLQLGKIKKEIEVRKKQAIEQGHLSSDLPTSLPPSIRWRDNLIRLGEELRLAEISSGPEAPNVVRLKQSIATTEELIKGEVSKYLKSVDTGMDAILSNLIAQKTIAESQLEGLQKQDALATDEAIQFQHKVQDLMGMRKLMQDTAERYNTANAKAEAQKVRWSILDEPNIERAPANKSLLSSIMLGFAVGAILGVIFAALLELGLIEKQYPKAFRALKASSHK